MHKGEAFGLVLHEAYNYGKKIATNAYGGQEDFLGKNYPYFIDYNLRNVKNMNQFNKWYDNNQQWGIPDLNHSEEILNKIKYEYRL